MNIKKMRGCLPSFMMVCQICRTPVKLDKPLMGQKIFNALTDVKTGKAPGSDGLNVDFF